MAAPKKNRRPAAPGERWVCGHCGTEGKCSHPREDRVPMSGLGPRPRDEHMDFQRPARRCECGHEEVAHQRGPEMLAAELARSALLWDKVGDLVLPCVCAGCRCKSFRCKVCARGPCRCPVTVVAISWARAKKRVRTRTTSEDLAAAAGRSGGAEWARKLAQAAQAEIDEREPDDDDE